jgi:uncharacterized protein YyaL (SSP411 family)
VHSTSPYLRQHAHNPVFWYPWGREAIDRARQENKPILLSIGYSTCYWCHVMEREVFENLSIASLMNRTFINIKVDREEHPELDEIYMIARQLMTQEGGWPNNIFLTPDLKPFYAGGTYMPEDSQGRPGFPRLLEWLNYSWTTQEENVRKTADDITNTMRQFLYAPAPIGAKPDPLAQSHSLFTLFEKHHDTRSGGFFQAPKFPHECFLNFLLQYYEHTDQVQALDIVSRTLGKMAAGGIYDHVGCGFHRYAVDKEWYVPHFEKMLYNQALLARTYTDAARLTSNEYFLSIARSVLDFVSGPMTSGSGAFYAAIDAETDGVEGAYYAWSSEELQLLLQPEEVNFFVNFFALADIPAFPGHKHANGQVIIARKPLDEAAREMNMPYIQLAAMTAKLMNQLLVVRNARKAPNLDDKIIVSWNGLMIDAFAHAGKVFDIEHYVEIARKAANYLLEHAIDNEGKLQRIIAGGKAQFAATLEDYAFLIKGLISLYRATDDKNMLESAISLFERADEIFSDVTPGYFYAQSSEYLLARIKSADDGAIPSANAVMAMNMVDFYQITKKTLYRDKARALMESFLTGKETVMAEQAGLLQAALKLDAIENGKPDKPIVYSAPAASGVAVPEGMVQASAVLFPQDAKAGDNCEVLITVDLKEGWHINANKVEQPYLIPTQADVQGAGIQVLGVDYPEPIRTEQGLLVYAGSITITVRIKLGAERKALKAWLRLQPCHGTTCYAVQDMALNV